MEVQINVGMNLGCVCQEYDPVTIDRRTQVLSWNHGIGAELKICSTTIGLSHFMMRILMFQRLSNAVESSSEGH